MSSSASLRLSSISLSPSFRPQLLPDSRFRRVQAAALFPLFKAETGHLPGVQESCAFPRVVLNYLATGSLLRLKVKFPTERCTRLSPLFWPLPSGPVRLALLQRRSLPPSKRDTIRKLLPSSSQRDTQEPHSRRLRAVEEYPRLKPFPATVAPST